MGDRANIVVQQEAGEPRIFLYTHWGGEDLPRALKAGLIAGRGRWDDPSYLTRLLAREMGMGRDGESGFGIALKQPDNEHAYLVVNCVDGTVTIEQEPNCKYLREPGVSGASRYTFAEYIALPNPTWDARD